MKLNVNRIIKNTFVEGYGKRFCIWTQGCSIRCESCANKDTWDFNVGEIWEVDSLVKKIELENEIDGITILGGEPLDQINAISELCTKVKKNGLSVILFTGYCIEKNKKFKNYNINKLLLNVDLLIDGQFEADNILEAPNLVGSKNQKIYYLTNYFIEKNYALNNGFEIRIESTGLVRINGMGNVLKLKKSIEESI